ncbi:hypothetical protein OIE66_18900 [Nonomuraea sp. NBC_01738]|uniref:hypothetical protein n=1 Tax=Nonomuraea sp. NBC_01738 TaxID=2976003 RepID=UPI002E13F8F2|nr:hypothetical protein OIE66_18900 [Nonomuraea sp. NBC_01738]
MRATLLAVPALLTALAFGATSAPVWADPAGSATQVTTEHQMKPKKKKTAQYKAGFNKGFDEGCIDGKFKLPFTPPRSGDSKFSKGFHDGYVSGFESCKP